MENQHQQDLKRNDSHNIENRALINQSSRWKTGLNKFKNNITKPPILSNNQENLLNQDLTASTENRQKIFIVNVEDNNVSDSFSENDQKSQTRMNLLSASSKKDSYPTSLNTHSCKTKKIFLASSLVNTNSSTQSENDSFEDKKVHFNSEVSAINDLPEFHKQKSKGTRPKTQLLQKASMLPSLSSSDSNLKVPSNLNQHGNGSNSYDIVNKSFEAYYKRRKEAIDAFRKKDWLNSERIYNMKVQKVHKLMNWKEFNPAAKVTFFTDNYITEEVLDETRREKKLSDLPRSSSVVEGRYKLPRERQITGYQSNRVFFWG